MASPAQITLFPRRAVIEFPKSKPTADALGRVEADDGQHYYVKTDTNGHSTRASEWISTHIAEAVGISTPAVVPIQMQDGSIVFGSRRVSGAADDVVTANYLTQPTVSNLGVPPSIGLTAILSSIYALDMFLFNDDRHLGNYLSYDDAGVRRLYAFDFSRCLFWAWPWQGFPAANTNTRRYGAILRHVHGFDGTVANGTLDRLDALSLRIIEDVLRRMPSDWLHATIRAEFVDWWSSGPRGSRVQDLRKGLTDGTLL